MAATPPAFNPAQQQRSGKNVWIWLILAVVFFCILLIVGIGFMVKSLATTVTSMMSCAMNGELATNAILAYAEENDGQLPNAETWQDDIMANYEQLYANRGEMFDTEDLPDLFQFNIAEPGSILTCNSGGEHDTGFAFNSALSGLNMSEIEDPDDTILIWETTTPGYNTFGDPSGRSDDDPALKLYGESRSWVDFLVSGDMNNESGENLDFRFDIEPEDGLVSPPTETPE